MAAVMERIQTALVDRYRIERELGRGGMATVFLAHDLRHRRSVAIKVLDPELAVAIGSERFLHEIETAAGLNHLHILPLHDSGSADGLLYYVMPFAEEESLRQRLEREPQLPLEEALRIIREVAGALDHAHRRGVVHRDIKPENILFQERHAMVADFGIARAIAAAGGRTLTTIGRVIGTPAYMSPEQTMGMPDIDGRSDVYSLGCMLYEMLGGQPPFTGPTAQSLAHQHLNVTARPLSELRPEVPEEVSAAVAKALAKTPEDRFASAAEFTEALALPAGGGDRAARRVRVHGRRATIGFVVALVGIAALVVWSFRTPISTLFGRQKTVHPTGKEWILVAEFEGPSNDPELAVATRDLVSAALDQSRIVATVPRDQVQLALRLAGMPDTTRMSAAISREIAYRRSVRAVVDGSIRRLGGAYTLVVRISDVERDSLILSVSDVADDEDALVPAIERVARQLRKGLGERSSAIRSSRELVQARTASFEAFKRFQRGFQLLLLGDDPGSIAQCREALALDADFAAAMNLIGYAYNNVGQVDSALAAFRVSLSRSDRLSDDARLLTEAVIAELEGDLSLSVARLDQLLQQNPSFMPAHNNRGYIHYKSGQFEAAVASAMQTAAVSPFGSGQLLIANHFAALLALGRSDEARVLARGFSGPFARSAPVWLASAAGDWALTDSVGRALEADPTASRELRRLGALAVAAAAATRGEVGAAARSIRRAEGFVGSRSTPAVRVCVQAAPRARLLLSLVSEGSLGDPAVAWPSDSTIAGLVTRGLWAAAGGDAIRARRLLERVRSRPKLELMRAGADPALLEGWIASRDGRWEETIRVLGPVARQGSEVGLPEDRAGRVTLRWLVAQAYEKLGRPDSAAVYFELLLSPGGRVDQEYLSRGTALPFAHHRLVLLYSRLGRLEDARRHWAALRGLLHRPDPEMGRLIEEARVTLANAERIARR